jgi:predicted dehydrogenase
MDSGVHLLDLMIWWLGKPEEVIYEDDAMGGIDANCRLQCKFSQGFTGEMRLSRDCLVPNRYVIHGDKGWLSWDVNDAADKIQMGFEDSSFALDAQIHNIDSQNPLSLGQPSFNFEQSFISQLCNVIAAMDGKEPLAVPGEEAIKSLRIIESCYRHRTLMPMPWLSDSESIRAHQLSTQL